MQDHIVVDVEIQRTIEETPGGWDATDKLGFVVNGNTGQVVKITA